MKRHVFLSYAREDTSSVEELSRIIRGMGHAIFYDQDISGGEAWWNELLTQIEQCEIFAPVISQAYLDSHPCALEATYAISMNRLIMPIEVENVPESLFDPAIAEANWVKDYAGDERSLLRLMDAITTRPDAPPLPSDPPARPGVPISYLTDVQREVASPEDLPRQRQLLILVDLKERLGTGDDRDARIVLTKLRDRSDVTARVKEEIESLLQPALSRPIAPPTPDGNRRFRLPRIRVSKRIAIGIGVGLLALAVAGVAYMSVKPPAPSPEPATGTAATPTEPAASVSEPLTWATYRGNYFSITYPSGWHVTKQDVYNPNSDATGTYYESVINDNTTSRILVDVHPASAITAEHHLTDLAAGSQWPTTSGPAPVTLNGRSGYRWEYDNGATHSADVGFDGPTTASYFILFTADKADYAQLDQQVFRRVLASFVPTSS